MGNNRCSYKFSFLKQYWKKTSSPSLPSKSHLILFQTWIRLSMQAGIYSYSLTRFIILVICSTLFIVKHIHYFSHLPDPSTFRNSLKCCMKFVKNSSKTQAYDVESIGSCLFACSFIALQLNQRCKCKIYHKGTASKFLTHSKVPINRLHSSICRFLKIF